jgi:hypothetical protein
MNLRRRPGPRGVSMAQRPEKSLQIDPRSGPSRSPERSQKDLHITQRATCRPLRSPSCRYIVRLCSSARRSAASVPCSRGAQRQVRARPPRHRTGGPCPQHPDDLQVADVVRGEHQRLVAAGQRGRGHRLGGHLGLLGQASSGRTFDAGASRQAGHGSRRRCRPPSLTHEAWGAAGGDGVQHLTPIGRARPLRPCDGLSRPRVLSSGPLRAARPFRRRCPWRAWPSVRDRRGRARRSRRHARSGLRRGRGG